MWLSIRLKHNITGKKTNSELHLSNTFVYLILTLPFNRSEQKCDSRAAFSVFLSLLGLQGLLTSVELKCSVRLSLIGRRDVTWLWLYLVQEGSLQSVKWKSMGTVPQPVRIWAITWMWTVAVTVISSIKCGTNQNENHIVVFHVKSFLEATFAMK